MSKLPPIPPASRSDKGPGGSDHTPRDIARQAGERRPEHPDQQGQQGNTRINTTRQGHQQDR